MKYQIVLANSARKDYERLDETSRADVREAMEKYLRDESVKTIKTRLKRLKGLKRPQFRLRVGDIRVYYDVNAHEQRVEVLGIVNRSRAEPWLKRRGEAK